MADLDEIMEHSKSLEKFRNSRVLILGGTGFVGTWLASSLLHANEKLQLNISIKILTRDVANAKKNLVIKNYDPIEFIEFDLQFINSTLSEPFDYYVHAATPSLVSTGSSIKNLVSSATQGGTKLISNNIQKFPDYSSVLHASSGAVYGRQLLSNGNQLEIDAKSESDLESEYSKAKVATEILLNELNTNRIAKVSNPRLFAFAGPRIELNEHFAIGNFLEDGLSGREIHMKGSPNTVRSYLYPTDLTIWILKLMANPTNTNLNFGSEISYSMAELANLISELTSKKGVSMHNPHAESSIYVPSTKNARNYLNVDERVSLEDAITRWIRWLEITRK